jgi:hypothetical protein
MVVAAYAQTLVEGRKVVVFGDCTSGLAERLLERGARLVHVYDSDLTRVAEAAAHGTSSEIAYAPLGQSGVAVRDGAFDFGVIENLAAADDAAALMTRLRRALAARGVAVVIAPNLEAEPVLLSDNERVRSGPSYYDMYELVSKEFDEVRMIGQTPFVGYAMADFTPGSADEFSIDTAFIEGGAEEAEWYVAVASHFPVAVDPFSVVQIPARAALDQLGDGVDTAALEQARRRITELEANAETAKQKSAGGAKDRELLLRAREEIEKRDAWVAELEARATIADARADEAESRADEAQANADAVQSQAAQLQHRLKEVQTRLAQAEKRLQSASTELRALEKRAERSEGDSERRGNQDLKALEARSARLLEKLEQRERELHEQQTTTEILTAELEDAERLLRERVERTNQLQNDLRDTEQLSTQLLFELELERRRESPASDTELTGEVATSTVGEADGSAPDIDELRSNLDELARVDARRVADLTAAQWTVQELESKLAEQEAEARAQLGQLRSELQQQSALLQQFQNSQPN